LILTDFKKEKIGRRFFEELRGKTNAKLFVMKTRSRDGEEPTRRVREPMLKADVILAVTLYSLTHTKAVKDCISLGKRVASMPNLSEFSLREGGLTADYQIVKKITEKIFRMLKNAKKLRVLSENGTNVEFSVEGREWYKDDSWLSEKGSLGNLPAGEVFVAPLEESVNGLIVFDSFPLSKSKLVLEVKNGKAYEAGNSNKNWKNFFSLERKQGRLQNLELELIQKLKL